MRSELKLAARRAGAYTVRDTPEVVQRIERDLGLVLAHVREADPGLRALVLTGGFARGEGSVLDGAPQNDYDLVALRGALRPRVPYVELRAQLEPRLGLHLDLQPVWAGRLRWTAPSIFWYETALRGRVLWGDAALLDRIPTRDPHQIAPGEGMRLLVNRAAGLLLAEPHGNDHALRIQASKAFLAVLDAHLIAAGAFAPSQRERWAIFEALERDGKAPPALTARRDWLAWGFRFKVDPARAEPRDAGAAWHAAASAILHAVPMALAAAGHDSVQAYARDDETLSNLLFRLRAGSVPGARRWAQHPTGKVRALTLAMLEARVHGTTCRPLLQPLLNDASTGDGEIDSLRRLRSATLQ